MHVQNACQTSKQENNAIYYQIKLPLPPTEPNCCADKSFFARTYVFIHSCIFRQTTASYCSVFFRLVAHPPQKIHDVSRIEEPTPHVLATAISLRRKFLLPLSRNRKFGETFPPSHSAWNFSTQRCLLYLACPTDTDTTKNITRSWSLFNQVSRLSAKKKTNHETSGKAILLITIRVHKTTKR